MKRIIDILSAFIVVFFIFLIGYTLYVKFNNWIDRPTDRASPFVGYSDSTWQVRDTLFVRYKGKVTGIDLTRLEGK